MALQPRPDEHDLVDHPAEPPYSSHCLQRCGSPCVSSIKHVHVLQQISTLKFLPACATRTPGLEPDLQTPSQERIAGLALAYSLAPVDAVARLRILSLCRQQPQALLTRGY